MTKLDKLMVQLEMLRETAQKQLDAEDTTAAEETMQNIEALEKKIDMQQKLDKTAQEKIAEQYENPHTKVHTSTPDAEKTAAADFHKTACTIRAVLKSVAGKRLTTEEKGMLLPNDTNPDGEHGEGYILPQDIRTQINSLLRDFRSMRGIIGSIYTKALTGSLVIDDVSNTAGLTAFEDGKELPESEAPNFKRAAFSQKEYGAIIPLSNVLIEMTDADLISYISAHFARKAVITENTKIIDALKKGKTAKALSGYAALKSSINKDLDPASLFGTVIVTNQTGFDLLDSQLDANGRPILQPDPTQPTRRVFMGYPVEVYSNAQLADEADGSAPIFYGNLQQAAKFVESGYYKFATSDHAGFTKNTTLARLVELFDVVQWDTSDKCYVYGKLSAAGE